MPELDISKVTTTGLDSSMSNYSVDTKQTEGPSGMKETYFINTKASQYFGYYKLIPELKKAIDAYAIWAFGRGYDADSNTTAILENIRGWGEDTFVSIMFNLGVCKKIYGDAFAEIIRDEDTGTLINLKVLDPATIKIVADEKGMIKRYEQFSKRNPANPTKTFSPEQMLHLCNDRIADEIHGTSVIEACEWVILARNEAMTDWRKVLHRNLYPIRIIEVDTDDVTKRNALKAQWEEAIKKGEVIILPKGTAEAKETNAVLQNPIEWVRYLENFFYQALGIPKVILGGSEEFTEASSKIGYLTFEQIYKREHAEFEADMWNQTALRIKMKEPVSLKNELFNSESKNTGQTGFQPSEIQPGQNE